MFSPYTVAQVNFKKLKEIGGEGKNSRAFIAHDYQLNAEVVVKEIRKEKLVHHETFFEESRVLFLSAHPNIVQIHYACEDDGCVYLAMPYYKNGSAKSLMAQRHLSVREIVRYSCQVLSALHNIHSKGLIHFDIKPDNILLSDRNEALLSDFGQAKFVDEDGFATPDGLYNRMVPPEVINVIELTTAVDIYQVGLTLYRMCNGDDSFYDQLGKLDANTFVDALTKGLFPDRKEFLPHIPLRLRRIIKKCLQVNPDDRYASALDVANDLALIDGEILDWQFDKVSGDNVWVKQTDCTSYKLVVAADGKSEMTKSKNGGKPQRVTAACKADMTMKEIEKILGSY